MRVVVIGVCVLSLVVSGCTYRFGAGARSSATPLAVSLPGAVVLSGPSAAVSPKTEAIIWYVIGGTLIVGGGALAIYDYTHDINDADDSFDPNGLLVIAGILVALGGVVAIAKGVTVANTAPPPLTQPYHAAPPVVQPQPGQPYAPAPGPAPAAYPPPQDPSAAPAAPTAPAAPGTPEPVSAPPGQLVPPASPSQPD
jgi:hypothetical protein